MENSYKNYIEVKDIVKFFEDFPDDTKIFFFEKDEDGKIYSNTNTSLDVYENFTYSIEENGKEEVKEEKQILAFVFSPTKR